MMMQVQTAILVGITAALSISTITQAQPVNEALNFNYTPEQCTTWVNAAISSDTVQSASGGLSQSEFMNFLNSIPQLESYFLDTSLFSANESGNIITFAGLPFEVQLAYPTLACWCEELGEGEGCCEGENNPRINVSALVEENPSDVAVAYKEDFCAFVALVIRALEKQEEGSITTVATTTTVATSSSTVAAVTTTTSTTTTADGATTTSTTQSSSPSIIATVKPTAPTDPTDPIEFTVFGSVINYSLEDPPQTTAKDILDNSESRNGVIGQLIQGFTKLSLEMLEKCPVWDVVEEKKRTSEPVKLTVLPPGILGSLDDTLVKDIPCPKGLSYAPENASCIAFTIIMKPSDELAQYEEVRSCLKIGIIRAIDDGRLYNIVEDISRKDTKITGLGLPGDGVDYLGYEKDGTSDVDVQESNEETASTGLGGGYIFLIILALFALPVVLFVAVRYRERNEEEMERVREFAGKPADDTDDLDLENPAAPATAVPAAAAVAPVVAAPLVLPKKEEEENESINDDDDDSSAPSVWSESRGSQADSVVDENATPTSAMMGSSLAAMGVASSVATNLYEKKTTGKEEVEEEKLDLETIKAEIKSLVESTAPGKSAEELLSAYGGKEEELLAHLRRLEKETKR